MANRCKNVHFPFSTVAAIATHGASTEYFSRFFPSILCRLLLPLEFAWLSELFDKFQSINSVCIRNVQPFHCICNYSVPQFRDHSGGLLLLDTLFLSTIFRLFLGKCFSDAVAFLMQLQCPCRPKFQQKSHFSNRLQLYRSQID